MCVETETPKASMGEWGRVRDLRSIVGRRVQAERNSSQNDFMVFMVRET